MADPQDAYTIVIFPKPTAKGYQFRIAKQRAKQLGIAAAALVVVFSLAALHYVVMLGHAWELRTLRLKSTTQEQELARYQELANDLKGQLERLREFDVKLRVMTNLNPPPDADGKAGIGGTEATPDGPPLDGKGGTEEAPPVTELEASLVSLQSDAARQEASFSELISSLRGRMTQWASTPSIWPVHGWYSSGFGRRLSPFTGTIMMHKGIDLAAYAGTPIVAPADGRVEAVDHDSGLGRVVVIDHGYGVKTLYAHLLRTYVSTGMRIKRGETIAAVGNSGLSTGPHLHYEIHVNGQAVDPLQYIIN
ncbi:MAG: M23 family metallopeptidase [Nitrospirae bacterium]|nr:M23 family metallopeptidase [Nitrospirota bacterium]